MVPVAADVALAMPPAPLAFSPAPPEPPTAVTAEVTAFAPLREVEAVAAPPAAPVTPMASLSPPVPADRRRQPADHRTGARVGRVVEGQARRRDAAHTAAPRRCRCRRLPPVVDCDSISVPPTVDPVTPLVSATAAPAPPPAPSKPKPPLPPISFAVTVTIEAPALVAEALAVPVAPAPPAFELPPSPSPPLPPVATAVAVTVFAVVAVPVAVAFAVLLLPAAAVSDRWPRKTRLSRRPPPTRCPHP